MPFIRRADINHDLRRKHDDSYRKRLRQGLLRPGLSAEERTDLREQLAKVGQPKEYSADFPPLPGAIGS